MNGSSEMKYELSLSLGSLLPPGGITRLNASLFNRFFCGWKCDVGF